MVFVFKKITFLSLILAIFRFKVLVFSNNKSYSIRKLERTFSNAIDSLIELAEYHDISYMEPDVFNGDYRKQIKLNVDNISNSSGLLDKLNHFFPNIESIDIKSKVYLHRYISGDFLQHEKIIHWLENSPYKNRYIMNFISMSPGMKYFWCNSNLRVVNIFNYISFFFAISIKAIRAFIVIVKKRTSYLFLFRKNKLSTETMASKADNKVYDVLFFPHDGLNMYRSGHPPKDHFYSKDIHSPFHPSNILHLEYDKRTDVDQEIPHIKKYLKVDEINYRKLIVSNIEIFSALKFILKLFLHTRWLDKGGFGNKIIHISVISVMYKNFVRYKNSISLYRDAKLALVGYDMLFPIGLSLALEHHKVHSVAIQERLLPPVTNDQAYILDTYLTISDFTMFNFGPQDDIYVKNRVAVGQVRTDHFFDTIKFSKSSYKLRVIFLDYQIGSKHQQQFSPFLNWKNDVKIRNDILDLAEFYPNIEFIFRGKNCDWFSNKFHHKVISRAKKLKNVRVDTNYDENFRSYHLCASADLIIARPTSLAEECVSAGMDVIVLDYGINYHIQVSRWIPELQTYHCHSFTQLQEMMNTFIKNGYVISDTDKNNIKEKVFSNLTDGRVKERVLSNLEIVYSKIL